jgi:hypothetical protein
VAFALACASAQPSRPVSTAVAAAAPDPTAAELLRQADEAWARRTDPAQAALAQRRYLEVARADRRSIAGLVGAVRAMSYRLDLGPVPGLADEGVQVAQWCQLRAPGEPECRYWLAVAMGHQLREQPAGGWARIAALTDLLREVAAKAPTLDEGGPHRLLALVLLRAPGWPLGPGDPAAGLEEARAAVACSPDSAANQLVLSMALAWTRQCEPARAAYLSARARAAAERGERALTLLLADAEAGLERCAAP